MSDIKKCSGEGCPVKGDCKRFLATDGFLQSWFLEPPIKDGKCDYYLPPLTVKIIKKER
jgi:hypothetical protein